MSKVNYAHRYPRFWFWYFWLSCGLVLLSAIESLVDALSLKASIFGAVGLTAAIASLWPLYGYVKQVRINPRWLWRIVYALTGLSLVLVTALVLFTAWRTSTVWLASVPVGVWLLSGPHLFALFQYIHRSPHIWVDA